MKTNHHRGFKDTRNPNAVYDNYIVFEGHRASNICDKIVGAHTTCGDHTNGKRGIAKDRRGAKKYINSRFRFHENNATRRLVSQGKDEDDVPE